MKSSWVSGPDYKLIVGLGAHTMYLRSRVYPIMRFLIPRCSMTTWWGLAGQKSYNNLASG